MLGGSELTFEAGFQKPVDCIGKVSACKGNRCTQYVGAGTVVAKTVQNPFGLVVFIKLNECLGKVMYNLRV